MSSNNLKAMRSVALVIEELDRYGWEVAIPLDHTSSADLVARKRSNIRAGWQTVQVKTAYKDRSTTVANVSRTTQEGREQYGAGSVDVFAIVDGLSVYWIPVRDIKSADRVYLSGGVWDDYLGGPMYG